MPARARILLVDDDERNLLALSEVLEPLAEVVTATSGRLALRELLKDDFAVILLDVFMPEMDGYETAALIRQRSQTARIPIIFLSAVNKETEHLMRGYAMGAVDYVFKPVDPVVLQVEGRGVRRPVPAAPASRRAGARRAGAARGEAPRRDRPARGRARAAAHPAAPGGDPRGAAAGALRGVARRAGPAATGASSAATSPRSPARPAPMIAMVWPAYFAVTSRALGGSTSGLRSGALGGFGAGVQASSRPRPHCPASSCRRHAMDLHGLQRSLPLAVRMRRSSSARAMPPRLSTPDARTSAMTGARSRARS